MGIRTNKMGLSDHIIDINLLGILQHVNILKRHVAYPDGLKHGRQYGNVLRGNGTCPFVDCSTHLTSFNRLRLILTPPVTHIRHFVPGILHSCSEIQRVCTFDIVIIGCSIDSTLTFINGIEKLSDVIIFRKHNFRS